MSQRLPRLDWVLTLLFGLLVLVAAVAFVRGREPGPASSCEEGSWAAMDVSCTAARNTSVTAAFALAGPWTVRIWLTTLEAVDARLHPPRQVADHPNTNVVVWLFIYENPNTGDRVLHVTRASNSKPGAYIYIHHWPDLGSPAVPDSMPAIYSSVGVRDY